MSDHPVLEALAFGLVIGTNDKDNERMLAAGQRIPLWKRHLALTLLLLYASPVLLLLLIAFVVVPFGETLHITAESVGTALGWGITIGLGIWVYVAATRAEKRWKQKK